MFTILVVHRTCSEMTSTNPMDTNVNDQSSILTSGAPVFEHLEIKKKNSDYLQEKIRPYSIHINFDLTAEKKQLLSKL